MTARDKMPKRCSMQPEVWPEVPYRSAQDADGLAGEHGVDDAGELAVAVPD